MPQDTSLQGDNHLLNSTFGDSYAFIELLYHLTYFSILSTRVSHPREFTKCFTGILINCVNVFLYSQRSSKDSSGGESSGHLLSI